MKKYATLYERLVANSKPEHDGANACWVWTGSMRGPYPAICVREPGRRTPHNYSAHRLMLEEIHDCYFPYDEAGHLCYNTRCINPDHLEIQTPAHNSSDRRYVRKSVDGRMIPILFPR